jgi:DeoR/GlpR family transcriptional regulator of sugar metabolism
MRRIGEEITTITANLAAIIARAKRRIILADQSKWQAPGTVLFSRWDDINAWVIDKLPVDALVALPSTVAIHQSNI